MATKLQRFTPYTISKNTRISLDTHILELFPATSPKVFKFKAGQYLNIKNPHYHKRDEVHSYSIASAPFIKDHFELCIKEYGSWSQSFLTLVPGNQVEVSGPYGDIVWDKKVTRVVFLVGGVGIGPVMSMIRLISEKYKKVHTVLLYGSRTEKDIAYREEIETRMQKLKRGKVIHILSHLEEGVVWDGYRGFITEEIIRKEVKLTTKPTFYMFGPPVFVEKMIQVLTKLKVKPTRIRSELH